MRSRYARRSASRGRCSVSRTAHSASCTFPESDRGRGTSCRASCWAMVEAPLTIRRAPRSCTKARPSASGSTPGWLPNRRSSAATNAARTSGGMGWAVGRPMLRLLREMASREDGRSIGLPPGQPIPPLVRAAFVAAEDRRFGSHPGVDPLALGRALVQDLGARRIVSGASTIAQQLARQLVPRPRSLSGKVQEALWAVRLTLHLPREALLRAYLDRIALGHDIFGVEAAAQLYFTRPASALSMGQAALLAGMAGSPARYDPYRHAEASERRIRETLRRMVRSGFVNVEGARMAAVAPLDLTPPSRVFAAPHLMTFLARSLPAMGLGRAVEIETTIDSELQDDVEALIREQLAGGRRIEQAAAIVIDNATGEVLAYAGSSDFLDEAREGQNDGVRSLRQPGSALKPFAYGLALSEGYTPATLLSDLEVHLSTPSGAYIPRNYDRRIHGP